MKKIFVLLALVFLVTGCSIQEMPNDNLEKVIDNVLTNKTDLQNQNFSGYQYYQPREVSLINKFDYNITLLHKGNKMYFYVDVISHYHKIDKEYNLKENIYLSKELEYGKKKGYINIEERDNDYFIEIEYNYGRIEAYSNKQNLTTTVINALYILNTLEFNDVVIESLIGENKIEYKEEKFNLFKSDSDDDGYLNTDKRHNSEDLDKENNIFEDEDTIKIEKDDELD